MRGTAQGGRSPPQAPGNFCGSSAVPSGAGVSKRGPPSHGPSARGRSHAAVATAQAGGMLRT